ncbi:Protein of unknown function [Pyronema omphalodes CBS 100304]|uniref:Uncharacterized protein n=1 Tax=Pyronema omphalodes (strain CBS 100304) TaxID=1076935 RepID=U4L9N3_PYROM|nr:Protein of unknown function [Pyronema omphalodes CBS 100304]
MLSFDSTSTYLQSPSALPTTPVVHRISLPAAGNRHEATRSDTKRQEARRKLSFLYPTV